MHHGQVRFEIRPGQVREKRRHLPGREHALVDDDLRGQRTDVEQLPLRQGLVAAQQMGRVLADEVKPALELVLGEGAGAADEQLEHVRHGGPGGIADVRAARIDRQLPPAQQPLPGALDFVLKKLEAAFPLLRVGGQEHVADAVAAGPGQFDTEFLCRGAAQEAVRQAEKDARPVAGIGFVAEAAAMLHGAVHAQRVLDHPAALAALDIAHEADAAAVLLERRIVQALFRRRPGDRRRSGVRPRRGAHGRGSARTKPWCSHGPILEPNAVPPLLRRARCRRGKHRQIKRSLAVLPGNR